MSSNGPSPAYSLWVCVQFGLLSTWCTLYNKYVFEHVFASSNCLLLVQNLVTLTVLLTGRYLGLLQFGINLRSIGDWIAGFAYGVNVMAGLWSLVYVNVAMFSALKRCTVVVSWVLEYLWTPTPTTMSSALPLSVMVSGTFIASFYDLEFKLVGYLLAILSCVAQGSAFELGRRVVVQNKGVCSVLFVNSVASICLQSILVFATGEMSFLSPSRLTPTVLFHFALNSISCLLMNYSVFLNCTVNSPLAHAVTGNVKAVATTLVGIVMFSTTILPLGWVGIITNFVGAGWFSVLKYQQAAAKSKQPHSHV